MADSEDFDPAESELSFGRNANTDRVHVIVPLRDGDDALTEETSLGVFTGWFRVRTLCGKLLPFGSTYRIEAFNDDQICMRCHKAMGEHSDRLFEHDQPTSNGTDHEL